MKTILFIKHLQGLLHNPALEWDEIRKSHYDSGWDILKDFYLVFLLLLPFSISLKLLFITRSLKVILTQGVIIPLLALVFFIFVLYLLSIVMEEAAALMKGKLMHLAGIKIAYFSAIPFLSLFILFPVPYLGILMVLGGFIYMIALMISGGKILLAVPANRIFLWILSVFVSFILLFLLFAVFGALISFFFNFL